MRFAIYCGELRGGGARAVGIGLLSTLSQKPQDHDITAYVPDDPQFSATAGGSIRVVSVANKGGGHHVNAHTRLREILRADPPDALFMMGNRGLVKSPCPQAVLIHNPWAVYPESVAWKKCTPRDYLYRRVRNHFILQGLRYSQVVAAQTPVMLARIHKQCGIPLERLALIPNSMTSVDAETPAETETSRKISATEHTTRAMCLSRYYTHKNIEILVKVADDLLAAGRTDIGIFVTVEATHGGRAPQFLKAIERNGRSRVLHNLGQIPMSHVASCYNVIDSLLLPTFMESYTNTYADSMGYGCPIITSDLDFAHTVCGEAACYIDPQSSAAIVGALASLKTEPDLWKRRIQIGRDRSARMVLDWPAISAKVVDMLECTATNRSVLHLLRDPWVLETTDLGPELEKLRPGGGPSPCPVPAAASGRTGAAT
jgi:glycosyltransferase involved in cell wall biosynthesis